MAVIEYLRDFGFFDIILPFIIIFIVVYFSISKLLKDKIIKLLLSKYIKSDNLSKLIFILFNLIISSKSTALIVTQENSPSLPVAISNNFLPNFVLIETVPAE